MGWNRKEGRENKDFKKGGQAGSKGGCLKKGGEEWAGTSLQFIMNIYISCFDVSSADELSKRKMAAVHRLI